MKKRTWSREYHGNHATLHRGARPAVWLILIVALVASTAGADPGECIDWEEEQCTQPCEAADSCEVDVDCGPGAVCFNGPGVCRPSSCICEDGVDYCSDDCVGRCVSSVPALSARGLLVFGLMMLGLGALVFTRHLRS